MCFPLVLRARPRVSPPSCLAHVTRCSNAVERRPSRDPRDYRPAVCSLRTGPSRAIPSLPAVVYGNRHYPSALLPDRARPGANSGPTQLTPSCHRGASPGHEPAASCRFKFSPRHARAALPGSSASDMSLGYPASCSLVPVCRRKRKTRCAEQISATGRCVMNGKWTACLTQRRTST